MDINKIMNMKYILQLTNNLDSSRIQPHSLSDEHLFWLVGQVRTLPPSSFPLFKRKMGTKGSKSLYLRGGGRGKVVPVLN
jgi:hypothetical protein